MNPDAASSPRLAILFWYYKSPEVCRDRLRRLRRLNPDTPIFGLYGGAPEQFAQYRSLQRWLDDNWCFDGAQDAEWKWRHGDLMINAWFASRGRELTWDSLAIMQWDMLAMAPLERVFSPLERDEIYLPGARRLAEVADFWWWVRPGTHEGTVFERYLAAMRAGGYQGEVWACQFLAAILPRSFLERYGSVPEPELGFLEYKLPTWAKAFGFVFRDYPHLPVVWEGEPAHTLRPVLFAGKAPISERAILQELLSAGGARLFHPVVRKYRFGLPSVAAAAVVDAIERRLRASPVQPEQASRGKASALQPPDHRA